MNSKLAVGLALGLLSLSAVADPVQPNPIVGPIPDPNTGNGGVMFGAFNPAGKSVVQYLGLRFNDFTRAAIEDQGGDGVVMFDVDMSVFGGDLTGVRFWVAAADYDALDATGWGLIYSAFNGDPGVLPNGGIIQNGQIDAGSNLTQQFGNFVNVTPGCGAVTPCNSMSGADSQNAANFTLQQALNFDHTIAISGSGAFFRATGSSESPFDDSNTEKFGNMIGQTVVSFANGKLVFTTPTNEVPLPAAAWLLLSGLLGLGAVSRRRPVAA
jgi:hypothetical protein